MLKTHRLKYEMFVRVRNFGTANREAFPEESGVGKKFGQLAAITASIEDQLIRRTIARADARKVKLTTRQKAQEFIKAIASTGRRATVEETGPHPFQLPPQRSATVVLASARALKQAAESRKEKFIELGMAPTFLDDFEKVIDALADAVDTQQNSRGTRRLALGAIKAALDRGAEIVADLDVAVPNTLRGDMARLAQWAGVRYIDHPSPADGEPEAPKVTAEANPQAPAAEADGALALNGPEDPELKVA